MFDGDAQLTSEQLTAVLDAKGRHRMPLDEVAFAGRWGQPLP